MHTLTIEIPDKFEKEEMLLSIAGQLYSKGVLTERQGADLAGMPLNEFLLAVLPDNDPLRKFIKPTKNYNSNEEWLEDLKAQHNYKGLDRDKLNKLIEKLDIQEPLELLLSQLTK